MGRLFFILFCIISGTLFFLFFPIYVTTNAYYDMNGRKLSFSVGLYGFLKLIGGYFATYQGGLAIHTSKKKAILIPYSQINNERKRFSAMRTFRLKTLRNTVETGPEYLLYVSLLQSVFRVIFLAMGGQEEKIENNLWLKNGDVLRISTQFTLRFNLFIIIRNFINIMKEKIKLLWQTTKKSTI